MTWKHLLFFSILTITPNRVYAEWAAQSCSSPHRIPVTITAGASGHSSETRIDLTSVDFPSDYVFSPAGDDVRVFRADDVTPVDFFVASWDAPTETATIFVRLPAIASGASETIRIYFGDGAFSSASDAPTVFPSSGMRLRSRVTTVDPTSAADALAAFAAATVDVSNALRTTISGLNNRAIGGTNGDYAWCVSAVLNVTSATAGNWGFRYGADFGRGGHLYVSGQALEEDWNDDLWWANNYANTAETLEGSINLVEGWHRYEALGFEGCCDGATGFQARAPGGAWQDLSSSNFLLRGVECIQSTATVTKATPQSCTTDLDANKTLTIVSDVAGNASPYALPGSIIRYDLVIANPGRTVDDGTIVLTDVLPPEVRVITTPGSFTFTDGAIPSGLSFTYGGPADATDAVSFSIDGIDFSYVPTVPSDSAVTHVRFTPENALNPNDAGDEPSFTISFLAEVE